MNSLADTLWTVVRWAVPVTVAAVVAAVAIGANRIGAEIRARVEARLQADYPDLVAEVQGASVVQGEGIVLRGVSLSDPRMPQQWRQVLWVDEVRIACGTTVADLAGGAPVIEGVRVRRPVVHAVRRAQGEWNLRRLLRAPGGTALPPLSIEEGTLLVDDLHRQARTTLRRLQAEITPQADGGVVLRGAAEGDLFGRASVQGSLAPATGAFDLAGSLEEAEISPRLLGIVAAEAEGVSGGEVSAWIRRWGGGIRARVALGWRATGSLADLAATRGSVAARVEGGRLEHASLPFPLRDVSAAVVADRAGLRCDRFEALTGSSIVRGSGTLSGWSADADFDVVAEAERLLVDRRWEGLLPDAWRVQWSRLQPAGEIDLRAQLTRRAGTVDPKVSVRCRNASLTHHRFPYRVDRTVGTVVLDGGALAVHLTGQAGGRPVHIEGTFRSAAGATTGALEVRGESMRVDDALLAAMPARTQTIVRSLRAGGVFDFVYRHERDPRHATGSSNSLAIGLVDCSMNYAGFPYPLARVRGSLRMKDGVWTIREIVGSNDTGTVRCTGGLVPRGKDDGELTLELAGAGVVLEPELRDALPASARRVWSDLDPRGSVDFRATVRHAVKARATSVEIRATPLGESVSIEPRWFPLRLERLQGAMEWKDGLLRFSGVRGRHGRTTVGAEGLCRFLPEGGWHVAFERLAIDRFQAEQDAVVDALPEPLRRAVAAVRPRGTVSLDGTLDVHASRAGAPAVASWDTTLDLEQATLDLGTTLEHVHGGVRLRGQSDGKAWHCDGELAIASALVRGIQVTRAEGPLAMDPSGVRFGAAAARPDGGEPRHLTARLAGGTLALDGSAGGAGGGFALAASLVDADLERITTDSGHGLPGSKPFQGRVFGGLELAGTRTGTQGLIGRGQVRLRDADIYELPVVLAMLKVLRVKAPDLRAFGSSVIDFRIEGPRAYLDNIELSGDAISLVGSGEIEPDTSLHLTFRSIMGDSESQLPAMKSVLGGASGNFLLIHVDGSLAAPEITSEAFPTLAAALQQWQEQARRQQAPVPPPPAALLTPGQRAAPPGVKPVGHLAPLEAPSPGTTAPDPSGYSVSPPLPDPRSLTPAETRLRCPFPCSAS
ncbi:MAG: hypothetical protein ACKO5R_10090 [Planctomycetaceae bacterium]